MLLQNGLHRRMQPVDNELPLVIQIGKPSNVYKTCQIWPVSISMMHYLNGPKTLLVIQLFVTQDGKGILRFMQASRHVRTSAPATEPKLILALTAVVQYFLKRQSNIDG